MQQDAVADGRLRPMSPLHELDEIYMSSLILATPLCENMTSSTKMEVYNALQCHLRTEYGHR